MLEHVFDVGVGASQQELRDLIERCERLKSAAAAAQARATALWSQKRRAFEGAAGVPSARRGAGLGAEVALARREAPRSGGRHLGLAQALVHEMPHTLKALESGQLSEWRATLIVRESACLSVEHRRALDAQLCAEADGFDGWGNARVAAAARRIAARLDAAAVADRAAKAVSERCVTIRPAPDSMAYLTALLPMAQGVAAYAALKREVDLCGDGRTRGQVMADTLYERVTGRTVTAPVSVALNLLMADTTLFGDDDCPGWCEDYGPISATALRLLVKEATAAHTATARAAAEAATVALRRLYRHPRSGQLVAMESTARLFPKGLARFIGLRDQTCRTPFCDAPIRHRDHATAHRDGGPTTATNGLGSCAACNYTKDQPGWTVHTTQKDGVHTATWTTPTAATYRSTAPPPPGPPVAPISPLEHRLGIDIVDLTTWRLKHTPTHGPPIHPDTGDDDGSEPGAPEHNQPPDGYASDGTEAPPGAVGTDADGAEPGETSCPPTASDGSVSDDSVSDDSVSDDSASDEPGFGAA